MEILLFIILAILFLITLLAYLEQQGNPWRAGAFFLFSIVFGAYLFVSGIQFQTGWTMTTSGATTTATIVNSNLVVAMEGLAYIGWLGIGIGLYGLIVRVVWPFLVFDKRKAETE